MDNRTLLTDNATLTDAAIAFDSIEKGFGVSDKVRINWLKFLENAVLYDKMVADDRVFNSHNWIAGLKSKIDIIDGIGVDFDIRLAINTEANSIIKKVSEEVSDYGIQDLNPYENKSNLKRLLFYLGLSYNKGLAYSPSYYRSALITNVSNYYDVGFGTKASIQDKLLDNLVLSAKQYADNVKSESGLDLIIAELPPISALVIDKAIQCGSWSEAIADLREKAVVRHFREWTQEVSYGMLTADLNALKKLSKVNSFIKGWSTDPSQGFRFKLNVGIGSIFKLLGLSKDDLEIGEVPLDLPNPFPQKHLVFLSDTFRSVIRSNENLSQMQRIKM
jgi:hypothetical protein